MTIMKAMASASTEKVNIGLGIGGLVAFLAWALNEFTGRQLTVEAGIGLATGLTFIVQKFMPDGPVTTEVLSDEKQA